MKISKLSSALASTAVIVTLAACSGSDSDSASTDSAATEAPATDAPATDAAPDTASTGDSESADADSAGPAVTLAKSRFDPVDLEVSVGDTVTFNNTDAFAHTVTSKDGEALEFDSGEFVKDETFEVTFDEPGTIAYFCQIHPTMRGTVTAG